MATVQNVYNLVSRAVENGLDETMHRLGVSLLAYSPLGFGPLTGKYDQGGIDGPMRPERRASRSYESVRKQRWGRPEALAAARRYNALARDARPDADAAWRWPSATPSGRWPAPSSA